MDVSVSFGEVADKITILRIKHGKSPDNTYITKELQQLTESFTAEREAKIPVQMDALQYINTVLWGVEDALRDMESRHSTTTIDFTRNAQQVYKLNDRRAALKLLINYILASPLQEVKLYTPYTITPMLVFLGNLGLGDQIILSSIVRYFSLSHQQTILFAKVTSGPTLRAIYADQLTATTARIVLHLLPTFEKDYGELKNVLEEVKKYPSSRYEYIFIGGYKVRLIDRQPAYPTPGKLFAREFFEQMYLPYNYRYDYFHLGESPSNARKAWIMRRINRRFPEGYIVRHQDPDRGFSFTPSPAASPLPIIDTHLLTDIIGEHQLADLLPILQGAASLHLLESSIAIFVDQMANSHHAIKFPTPVHIYMKSPSDTAAQFNGLYKIPVVFHTCNNTN